MQIFVNFCKFLQIFVNFCKFLQNFTKFCKILQNFCKFWTFFGNFFPGGVKFCKFWTFFVFRENFIFVKNEYSSVKMKLPIFAIFANFAHPGKFAFSGFSREIAKFTKNTVKMSFTRKFAGVRNVCTRRNLQISANFSRFSTFFSTFFS